MNPSSLSPFPHGLNVGQTRQWLAGVQAQLRRDSDSTWQQAVEAHRPPAASAQNDEGFTAWADAHQLREPWGGDWTVSMKGVGFILSHDRPRLTPDQAWERAGDLLAKVAWINQAPVELAPMEVADVILFGSMSQPASTDHGDMDVLLVLQSKRSDAFSAHETFLRQHDLLPKGGWYSYRQELERILEASDPFVSAITQVQPLQALLDQDPGFSAFSLMGKTWTESDLAHTTVDEEAFAVLQALENGHGHPSWKAHVQRRLQALNAQPVADEPDRACAGVVGNPDLPASAQIAWASAGPLPAVPAALKEQALNLFKHASHPVAAELEKAWGKAPLRRQPSGKPTP